MYIELCKKFFKNMNHGYALIRIKGINEYELFEYNQEFGRMFNVADKNIPDFASFLKINNDTLSINLFKALNNFIKDEKKNTWIHLRIII